MFLMFLMLSMSSSLLLVLLLLMSSLKFVLLLMLLLTLLTFVSRLFCQSRVSSQILLASLCLSFFLFHFSSHSLTCSSTSTLSLSLSRYSLCHLLSFFALKQKHLFIYQSTYQKHKLSHLKTLTKVASKQASFIILSHMLHLCLLHSISLFPSDTLAYNPPHLMFII